MTSITSHSGAARTAIGARMTGGGFGGSANALVPADAAQHVGNAVLSEFATHGLRAPGVFAVLPYDGTRRL